MLVLRALVGIAETFSQGAVFYLSFWYTYKELALRGAIFQSLASIAGAFNGLLSYGIAMSLGGKNGWSAWRWIFLIEGVCFDETVRVPF
jgi:MFS family permease